MQDDDISKPEEDGEGAQDLTVSSELKQHINTLGLSVAKQTAFKEDWKQAARMEQGAGETKQQPERMEEEEEEEEVEEDMPEDLTERRPTFEPPQFTAEVPRRTDEEENIAE